MESQSEVPEIHVRLDRERLARNGVSFAEAGLTLRAALYGAPVSRVYEGRNAYDLVLRVQGASSDSVATLEQLPLRTDTGALAPLGAVSTGARDKYWPAVARVDGAFGDRNLVCSCPPIEAFAE